MDDHTWTQTYTGKQFWPLEPQGEAIQIDDLAHSLSLQCRFNGHCRVFYSVAEHSVRVSNILGPKNQLWGLLHDAAEAYLGDLVRPIKCQPAACWFNEAEARLLQVVAKKFGLSWPMPQAVALADNRLLVTEARDLLGPPPASWGRLPKPLSDKIEPWTALQAEKAYLQRFKELT